MTKKRRPFKGPCEWMTAWWGEHLKTRPVVVIECGACREKEKVGEVKRDGSVVLALKCMVFPEPTVPRPDVIVLADRDEPDAIRQRLDLAHADRQKHVLKPGPPTPDGRLTDVMRQNRDQPDAVGAIEMFRSYVCPEHGELPVDINDLKQFVDATDEKISVRKYRAYPSV
jgi:hypothetical protein